MNLYTLTKSSRSLQKSFKAKLFFGTTKEIFLYFIFAMNQGSNKHAQNFIFVLSEQRTRALMQLIFPYPLIDSYFLSICILMIKYILIFNLNVFQFVIYIPGKDYECYSMCIENEQFCVNGIF